MNAPTALTSTTGKWMALTAALLGWLFDGLEMGLFPLVARPALRELLPREVGMTDAVFEALVGKWFGIATAGFLIGAATGGVLFGWLGDRIGRVRAMSLSVLTYALVTGLCGFADQAWQIAVLRFIAALGMGGEWSLGVALINEIWPAKSRAFLAGLIGAAANVGYLLVGVVSKGINAVSGDVQVLLANLGLSSETVDSLMAHERWRLLMILGASPAVLTFFIRLFVPESERWQREKERGATSHWASRDLLGVLVGAGGATLIIVVWASADLALTLRILGTAVGFAVALGGFVYPVWRYLQRSETAETLAMHRTGPTLGRMLFAAALAGIALIGTWGSTQWASVYAAELVQKYEEAGSQNAESQSPEAKAAISKKSGAARESTLIWASLGAIIGTILAAFLGDLVGRRISYFALCAGSLASALVFYQTTVQYDVAFLCKALVLGFMTASFYGWLPLYLPELFRTSVRATGQGFGFNFGRILAAIGALQTGNLFPLLGGYANACSVISLVYVFGMAVIWLAPETKGQPLPE